MTPTSFLPRGWKAQTLGEVLVRIEAGVSPKAMDRPVIGDEIGVLKVSAVTWGDFRPHENKALTAGFDPTGWPRVERGDLLLSRANTAELLASPVIARANYPNLLLSDKTLKLVPNRERADTSYLYYALRTSPLRRYFAAHATGTSGSMRNVSQETIRACPIPLPPLAEQQRIAGILDQADAVRRKRQQALALTDQFLRATFLDMFGDPVTNPKGFTTASFGDRLEMLQYGPRFFNESYSDSGIRIVRITDLNSAGFLDYSAMPRMAVSDADRTNYGLRSGDLLLARTGATVGKSALIADDAPEAIAGAYFIRMRFAEDILPLYAQMVLRAGSVQAIIAQRSRQSAQQNFNGPGIRALPLPIPPIKLQGKFAQFHAVLAAMSEKAETHSQSAAVLFDSLVQRAFRGEL